MSALSLTAALDPAGVWRLLAGSRDQWSPTPASTVRVDAPAEGGSYLVSPPVPALDGGYRVTARVQIGEPDHGLPVCSADLLLNARDLDTAYLVRFRIRNGVRYVTLVKRVDGMQEELADDICAFSFDEWLDVDVTLRGGRLEIVVDGRTVVSCAEFDRLAGGAVGLGASGAMARFDALEVTALGPDDGLAAAPRVVVGDHQQSGERRKCGTVANESYRVEITTDATATYQAELAIRDGDEWRPASTGEQWLILSGDAGSRRNLYASLTNHRVAFTELDWLDERRVRLRAPDQTPGALTVTWDLTGQRPQVQLVLTPKTDGHYVVGYHPFGSRPFDEVDEVLCGPLQHARMVRGVESIGRGELTAPLSLVQHTEDDAPVTVGLYVPPSQLPFEYEPSMGDDAQPFGMSLRDADGGVQPILYAPQYGQLAAMRAGDEYRFEVGLYAGRSELFEAYRQLLRTEYGYRPYRQNVFGASLTDTVHNLIDLLKSGPEEDDSVEYQGSPSGWWSRAKGFIDIENDQAVRATTTSVLLSAAYLTADDELYETRARPIIEYHLSRNGYGWTPAKDRTVYGAPGKHRLCATPFGAPALAPLSAMTAGRAPVVEHLALDQLDAEDYWLKRAPMSAPLAAYRMTGDPALLARAEELARAYIATEIDTAYTDNVDPHDFQNYYSKAWADLLEMYEETEDKTYLDAAYREAKRYVTQVFVRPVPDGSVTVPDRPLFVDRQIELTGWWDPDALYQYPKTDVEPEKVPRWVLSPNGLSFEALKTYRFNGFTMNPAWAPFLLRLASYVGDDLLRDVAHNAVVGRYTNYPGYYYRQFTVHHLKPDFPFTGPFGNTTIYYHHAPAQLGMTMDYLLAEHQTRSGGNIAFPSELEQNYVWFAYRVYGHRPGTFYGYGGAWLWMPRGLVSTSNEQVNWIVAEGGDRLFISLTNESGSTEHVRLRLDPALVPMDDGRPYRATVVPDNGGPAEASMTDHTLETTVSPHGITAIIVHGVGPFEIPWHTTPTVETAPGGRSYHLDDHTPLGAVWGMVLVRPDHRGYDAYVQTTTDGPATLCYSTDGGATFTRMERHVYPHEWTVPVHDLSATFTYYVEAGNRRSEPVELTCPGGPHRT